MKITIEVLGEKAVSRKLVNMIDTGQNLAPAFELMTEALMADEAEQFYSEGQHGSGGWAPLAPHTLAMKIAKGQDTRILHRTGALSESLMSRGGDNVSIVERDWMVFGTSLPYAKYHQDGTYKMPRRRPVQLTEVERKEIVKILQRYIVEASRV